jgi:heme exporter protein D
MDSAMDLGPHAFFIVAAYVVTGVIVGGLILRAVVEHRSQRRALAALESRGVRRRSDVPTIASGETVAAEGAGRGASVGA